MWWWNKGKLAKVVFSLNTWKSADEGDIKAMSKRRVLL